MTVRERILEAARGLVPNQEGRVRARCPFCLERTGKPDQRGSFSFHTRDGFYACFKCGARGRVWTDESHGDDPPERPIVDVGVGPPDGFLRLGDDEVWTARVTQEAREYLAGRGIDRPLIAETGIGCCLSGVAAGRVIVPIFGTDGHTWLGWSGRAWTAEKVPKPYRYPAGMRRGEILYNHQSLGLPSGVGPAYVVEGVFDALALWPAGVAVLGKPSPWQVQALAGAPRPIVVCLDGDAWMEGWALAQKLRILGQTAGALRLPPQMDPDEIDRGHLDELAHRSLTTRVPISV